MRKAEHARRRKHDAKSTKRVKDAREERISSTSYA
jgi:hypothetical protein